MQKILRIGDTDEWKSIYLINTWQFTLCTIMIFEYCGIRGLSVTLHSKKKRCLSPALSHRESRKAKVKGMSVEQLKTVQQALDMKVLMNHIYEYKKGVRQMILFTCNARYEDFAVNRLQSQNIEYIIQRVGNCNINIFFGRKQCLDAIRIIVDKPLARLSPEHDFIIGALLGYDICCQCERFCERKQRERVAS